MAFALAVITAAALIVYGLAVKTTDFGQLVGRLVPGGPPLVLAVGSLLASACFARWSGHSPVSHFRARLKGRGGRRLLWGAAGALLLGVATSAATIAGIVWLGAPLVTEDAGELSGAELARKALADDPLQVAVPEELAFRLLLWDLFSAARLRRPTREPWMPLLATSLAFGAWHLGDGLQHGTREALGAVIIAGLGGAGIGVLFARTGSLPVAILAHALADAGIGFARHALIHFAGW